MIIEMRIYTTRVGKMDAYVEVYKKYAWDLTQKYLGPCIGYYVTVDGPLNQLVHIRSYDNAGDRETRRAAMLADPGWKVYQKNSRELDALVSQETRLLKPTEFSP
jgi:hypothetical protein